MELVIFTDKNMISKTDWINEKPSFRNGWNEICDIIRSWFCFSNDFNHNDDLSIIYENFRIKLKGNEIRYLGPSFRSCISLISKAFMKIENYEGGVVESTPGIYLSKWNNYSEFEEPFFDIEMMNESFEKYISEGTIFINSNKYFEKINLVGSRVSQGLIWFMQKRDLF